MAISPDGYERAGVEAVLVYLVARLLRCLTDDDYRALGTLLATIERHEHVSERDLYWVDGQGGNTGAWVERQEAADRIGEP